MTRPVAERAVAVVLPLDLAPSLTERVVRLLAEVDLTAAPDLVVEVVDHPVHRCVVCHRGGKLGGHHSADGRVQWIHRKCHRRLHRSGRHDAVIPPGQSRRYAC